MRRSEPRSVTTLLRRHWIISTVIGVLVLLSLTASILMRTPPFGASMTGERLARARANPHYKDGVFVNPHPPAEDSCRESELAARQAIHRR